MRTRPSVLHPSSPGRVPRLALALALLLASACDVEVNMSWGGPGFFDFPWPNHIRKNADGTLDLDGYPGTQNGLFRNIVDLGAAVTTDFGNNAGVFFTTSGEVDPASFPRPETSTGPASPVMLVRLRPAYSRPLVRVPVSVDFKIAGTRYRPARTLAVLPYPGFPLDEGARYAVILTSGLTNVDGEPLLRAPLVDTLAGPYDASTGLDAAQFAELQTQRAEVMDYVDRFTDWSPDDVIAFTVYETQRPAEEMTAITAAVAALPAPSVNDVSVVRSCAGNEEAILEGTVDLPRWQEGDSPYITSGGGIVVENGLAQVQFLETAQYRAVFPCDPAPPGGWPYLVHVGGTGGTYKGGSSFVSRYFGTGVDLRMAVFSVAPYMSGDRADPDLQELIDLLALLGLNLDEDDVAALAFFNVLNPLAGRNNQRQQGADAMFLERVARGFSEPGATVGAPSDLTTDDGSTHYFGHSQGAVSGPLALFGGVFDSAFLSSPGGGLYHPVLHRDDVRPIVNTLLFLPADELDEFHPLPQIVQTLAEMGDPANYADEVTTDNLFLSEGIDDGCSIREGVEHVAAAMGMEVADPTIQDVFAIQTLQGKPPIPLPATANLPDGRTGVLLQLDAGHFGVSANPDLVRSFFDGVLDTGSAIIPAGPFNPAPDSQCVRYD